MHSVSVLRQTIANIALRALGTSRANSRTYAGQRIGELFPNTVLALPAKATNRLQDLDTTSPTYGEFYYLAGYDPVGSGPISP